MTVQLTLCYSSLYFFKDFAPQLAKCLYLSLSLHGASQAYVKEMFKNLGLNASRGVTITWKGRRLPLLPLLLLLYYYVIVGTIWTLNDKHVLVFVFGAPAPSPCWKIPAYPAPWPLPVSAKFPPGHSSGYRLAHLLLVFSEAPPPLGAIFHSFLVLAAAGGVRQN